MNCTTPLKRQVALCRALPRPCSQLAVCKPHAIRAALRLCLCRSSSRSSSTDKTINSLDSLLGGEGEKDASKPKEEELVEWWKVKPKQSAPPRTTSLAQGEVDRFMLRNTSFFRSDLHTGQLTEEGRPVDVPQVVPLLSWGVMLVQVVVFLTGMQLDTQQGSEALAEYLEPLVISLEPIMKDGEWWRLITASCVSMSAPQLAANVASLLLLAPKLEAALRYPTFTFIYLMSAITSGIASLAAALGDVPLTASPTTSDAAIFGLLGAGVALAARNPELVLGIKNTGRTGNEDGSPALGVGASPIMLGSVGLCVMAQLVLASLGGETGEMQGDAVGFIAGLLLGSAMNPAWCITREVQIPDGSMVIPEDAPERVVVVDKTTDAQRSTVAALYMAALVGSAVLFL